MIVKKMGLVAQASAPVSFPLLTLLSIMSMVSSILIADAGKGMGHYNDNRTVQVPPTGISPFRAGIHRISI